MKILGKERYLWFFDPLTSIIYWSFVLTLIFSGIIVIMELLGRPLLMIIIPAVIIFSIALILIVLGLHRHFWLDQERSLLNIFSLWKSQRQTISIASISKIMIIKNYLIIYSKEFSTGKECYNIPVLWRRPFIDDLSKNEKFTGKIIK